MIGINRVGVDGNEVEYSGDSRAFDFTGLRMDEFKTNETQVQELEFNISKLKDFRKRFPAGKDSDEFKIY